MGSNLTKVMPHVDASKVVSAVFKYYKVKRSTHGPIDRFRRLAIFISERGTQNRQIDSSALLDIQTA